ncbi:methylglutaconyl-CoA hydratase [Kwoniella heveanensis CBS 569]|nr:methylglutaconyl-CoA hydratase [Kwoniella heveanensis CBS 569]
MAKMSEELGGVMCLVLNRPETKNALSVRMVGEMREALAKLDSMPAPSARVLLLHSSSPGLFCSGADLRERRTMSPSQVSDFLDSLRNMLAELEGIKMPSIAVVDGYALGGGAELALACDLRVGGEHTKIALPETKLGIIPGAGGTQRLTHLIGVSRAKELIYTGRHVNGAEAEWIGLINSLARAPPPPPEEPTSSASCCPTPHAHNHNHDHGNNHPPSPAPSAPSKPAPAPSSAFEAALLLSRQISTSAPLSLHAAKQAITSAPFLSLDQGLDLERRMYEGLLGSEDRLEGLRAFAEKRRAVFKGL